MIKDFFKLNIDGVKIFNLYNYQDKRGEFKEVYLSNTDNEEFNLKYVQENESISSKNVFRGMHFQEGEYSQCKLLRVVQGSVFDLLFDMRKTSITYKKIISFELKKNQILYIPNGIAHGFLSLEENTIINYKCDKYYNKKKESGFNPFKSKLDIKWPVNINNIICSEKDNQLPSLEKLCLF